MAIHDFIILNVVRRIEDLNMCSTASSWCFRNVVDETGISCEEEFALFIL
jgi:hypothetical protein